MALRFAFLTATLCVALLACSSSKPSSGTTPGDDGGTDGSTTAGFVPLPASPTTFDMAFTVAAGSEDFECTYVTMPSTPGFIVGAQHEYTVGSHHILLYRTNLTSIPAGQASPALGDCYAATANYMNTISGVIYGGATPTGEMVLPAGVGYPYSANDVFLFQAHYLNATAKPISAQVSVHFTTQTTPVQYSAGTLFFYDPFIYVPPGVRATASTRCPITQDITLISQGSHYHARGVGYQAYLDTAGTPAATPFYTSNSWASPEIGTTTMPIAAGSHIRFYCDYDNSQGTQTYIQGPSAANNEMCMFVGLYYPAMPTADEQCYSGDTYGTGTVSCADTLTCLGACPPGDAGVPTGSGQPNLDFNQCIQQCFAASCPNATSPLVTALSCIQSSCSTQCAGQGTACATCVAMSCGTQYEACANAACGTVPAP
jgi:hypothetical protein